MDKRGPIAQHGCMESPEQEFSDSGTSQPVVSRAPMQDERSVLRRILWWHMDCTKQWPDTRKQSMIMATFHWPYERSYIEAHAPPHGHQNVTLQHVKNTRTIQYPGAWPSVLESPLEEQNQREWVGCPDERKKRIHVGQVQGMFPMFFHNKRPIHRSLP